MCQKHEDGLGESGCSSGANWLRSWAASGMYCDIISHAKNIQKHSGSSSYTQACSILQYTSILPWHRIKILEHQHAASRLILEAALTSSYAKTLLCFGIKKRAYENSYASLDSLDQLNHEFEILLKKAQIVTYNQNVSAPYG